MKNTTTEKKMAFIIKDTEIVDQTCEGDMNRSAISVVVEIEIDSEIFYVDYQTSTTFDAGAVSTSLDAYDGSSDYDEIEEKMGEDFFEMLLEKSGAQEIYEDYLEENYVLNSEHFGGMDANSEFDEIWEK